MQTLELLSPARNLECGICAIDHGADAVYIGADKFGARAAAGNSVEDIQKLCNHAHLYGAKVYVTVNTIIYDNEIIDTIEMCRQLESIGVDALLLQDMGLLTTLKSDSKLSHLNLHASTQTDNRTADKVLWLASQGFKRIVLARELSIKEIEDIHKKAPEVELEVFVHGALCVSYSGQCYASHYCFGRSANRGECAQFCRMPFTLADAAGNILEESSHLLSLKDMAQLANLERLANAGAVSFKIEGRLKDTDYVKNITAAYSEELNRICSNHPEKYRRASMGRCTYTFIPNINKSFNRGFTTYFADGRQKGLISPDTPKAIGEYVGKVKELRANSFNVSTTKSFSNGDGLCFFSSRHKLVGFRVNKAEGNRLFPQQMPRDLKPGTPLYRNHDQAFQQLLTRQTSERKISVSMNLLISDNILTLTMTDEHKGIYTVSTQYDYQTATTPQAENIKRQLTKLGSTPFTCHQFKITCDGEVPFIPNSILSELRRNVVQATKKQPQEVSSENICNTNVILPHYNEDYLYNAANEKAKEFYEHHGICASSFEKDANITNHNRLIMQCRFCLRYEMGYCKKEGHKSPWKEPLTLSLDDGKTFQIKFNCKECQMEIWT